MPSEESLSKAVRCSFLIVHEVFILWQVSLVKSAIAKDTGGESAAAINLYCESLEYFIPIIKCQHKSFSNVITNVDFSDEQNLQKKEELRRKVV